MTPVSEIKLKKNILHLILTKRPRRYAVSESRVKCSRNVQVVSPFARSNLNKPHKTLYHEGEQQKDREYKARINQVEQADFTPLVFTTAGGMAPRMQLFLKRISLLMSEQQDLANSVVSGWLRCRFSFALLRTTLVCLRGTRRKRYTPHVDDIGRAVCESRIDF